MPTLKRRLIPGRNRTRVKLPTIVSHEVVRVIWQTIDERDDLTVRGVCARAGIDETTLRGWRNGSNAHIANVEAVLNAMGLKIAIIPC